MKLVSMAIITLASATAMAAGPKTEYFFRPDGGKQALELKYRMNVLPAKVAVGTVETDVKQEINDFYFTYAYGLSDNHTLGVETFFGSNKMTFGTTNHTADGMGDLHLFYKGFAGMWYYGADLGLNMGKIGYDETSGFVDNRSSGGMSLKASAGLLMTSEALNYGADLSYMLPFERQQDDADATKYTGGNTLRLAPFIEYNWGMGFVGAELAYTMIDDTTEKDNNGETKNKGESYLSLALNGSYDFNEMATGLLTLGMGMHPERDITAGSTNKLKAYTETIASLGVRLNF